MGANFQPGYTNDVKENRKIVTGSMWRKTVQVRETERTAPAGSRSLSRERAIFAHGVTPGATHSQTAINMVGNSVGKPMSSIERPMVN